jgi:hypothetical protein
VTSVLWLTVSPDLFSPLVPQLARKAQGATKDLACPHPAVHRDQCLVDPQAIGRPLASPPPQPWARPHCPRLENHDQHQKKKANSKVGLPIGNKSFSSTVVSPGLITRSEIFHHAVGPHGGSYILEQPNVVRAKSGEKS